MESKNLVISEKEALRLYPNASNDLKIILEETFTKEFFNTKITDIVFDEETLANYLKINLNSLLIYSSNTINKRELYINACIILPEIAKIYNEDKILNWSNTNEYKYLPYKNFSGGGSGGVGFFGWCGGLVCPCGFYFKNKQLAEIAYNNFKKYYKAFWNY